MICHYALDFEHVRNYRGNVAESLRVEIRSAALTEAVLFDAWLAKHVEDCDCCTAKYLAASKRGSVDIAKDSWQQLLAKVGD